MIWTRNLCFAYNTSTVFRFPDLICEKGQGLLISGASGKGKTTLLHLLAGLLNPHDGEIWIGNENLAILRGHKLDRFRAQHIGLVFQQAHFIASLSVLENLVAAGWLSTGRKDREKAQHLLDRLGVGSLAHYKPHQLSAGQQQRAAIARALMNNPIVLLADEPTSSLDDENAQIVADLLLQQAEEIKASLIVVTHDYRLKKYFSQSIHLS
ncbi:MAG: ATP-binding cassette domain-containing protein [Saprospiraceae bacterium]|nr:ATP-binding cassette domain-containing protein [Saprospiraceae bacterium]MDW8485112.1 ATP-binding cassette domain-containing protein [Saprospiraceae bacterium]